MALELGTDLRCRFFNGQLCWCIRDFGRLLGYGADGGNLSRNVRGKWVQDLKPLVHYHEADVEKKKDPKKNSALWATPEGIKRILNLIAYGEPLKYRRAVEAFWKMRTNGSSLAMKTKPQLKKKVVKKSTKKSTKKHLKGSIYYTVQRGKDKHGLFVVEPDDPYLNEIKRKSYHAVKGINPRHLNRWQKMIRELVMLNRHHASKNGQARINDHLKYACKRPGLRGEMAGMPVPESRIKKE